ncbi:hypothetical protein NB722_001951 [Xanthomonas sacchari]|uniref:hypothetical protein n=1 Tax=Xanthomonas sacchari TaxID=56458 RepID=UPI002255B2EF|nr:hypothetical protein [Xanthomonas sacchari]MCW0387412.1 hypothetical protein [Xanthomonas sacchari]
MLTLDARLQAETLMRLIKQPVVIAFLSKNLGGNSDYHLKIVEQLAQLAISTKLNARNFLYAPDPAALYARSYHYGWNLSTEGSLIDLKQLLQAGGQSVKRSIDLDLVRLGLLCGCVKRINKSLSYAVVRDAIGVPDEEPTFTCRPGFWCLDIIGDEIAEALYESEEILLNSSTYRRLCPQSKDLARRESETDRIKLKKIDGTRHARLFQVGKITLAAALASLIADSWSMLFLLLIPCLDAFQQIIYAFFCTSQPATLKSFDQEELNGADVTIVIPLLLHRDSDVIAIVSNISRAASYSRSVKRVILLTDFPDRLIAEEGHSEKQKLINLATEAEIGFSGQRFTWEILHRCNVIRKDGTFWGWERKRGKILDLCYAISSGKCPFFTRIGHQHDLTKIDIVFIMDEDTVIVDDCVDWLYLSTRYVEVSSHLDYHSPGIIVPTIASGIKAESNPLITAMRHISRTGFYSTLFSQGIFSGKGMMSARAYLDNSSKLPEGCILSHDTLENYIMGAAIHPIAAIKESPPSTYLSHAARLHRWMRGDIQNFIFGRSYANQGFPLTHRWDLIITRLSQIFFPIFFVGLLIQGHFLVLSCLIFAPWVAFLLMWIYRNISPSFYFLYVFIVTICEIFRAEIVRVILSCHSSFLLVDATITSVFRALRKSSRLLEWTPTSRIGGNIHVNRSLLISGLSGIGIMIFTAVNNFSLEYAFTFFVAAVWTAFPLIQTRHFNARK